MPDTTDVWSDRVLQGQTETVYAYWERNGTAWDPGSTTVTILNDEGQTLVTSAAATVAATGVRSFQLPLTAVATLDTLTIQWKASDNSVLTTYAEIVGGYYFSVAQARQRTPLMDTTTYPNQKIIEYRTMAEQALDDICGLSFVPRYSHDLGAIAGWGLIKVPRRQVQKVRNIFTQQDDGPHPLTTLAGLRIMSGGGIFMPSYWNWWQLPITVAYEHGLPSVPARVSRAALELARRWIVESPWDERTTAFRTRDGGEMTILTAGSSGGGTGGAPRVIAAYDIPEVQAVAEQYGMPAVI